MLLFQASDVRSRIRCQIPDARGQGWYLSNCHLTNAMDVKVFFFWFAILSKIRVAFFLFRAIIRRNIRRMARKAHRNGIL